MSEDRRYVFSWELLGDISLGRPHLGPNTSVEVYRLMQFTFRDVIEGRFGSEVADEVFYEAGLLAGRAFYHNVIGEVSDFQEFVRKLQHILQEMGVGILRVENADLEQGSLVLTISEDLDCSGLPELDTEICKYDEGFLAALLECFSGKAFSVKEVDCWCTGDRTCRFAADIVK